MTDLEPGSRLRQIPERVKIETVSGRECIDDPKEEK